MEPAAAEAATKFSIAWGAVGLFCLTSLAFWFSRGTALYLVGLQADRGGGTRAAVAAVLAIVSVHFFFYTLSTYIVDGLLRVAGEWLFIARWAGAAYFLCEASEMARMGISQNGPSDDDKSEKKRPPVPALNTYVASYWVHLTTPRTAAFFLVFLPLYVDPSQRADVQIFILMFAAIFVELPALTAYALLAQRKGVRIGGRRESVLFRACALLLCAAAIALPFVEF